MAFPGECISTGAKDHTQDPNVSPLKVMQSAAGYYIGTSYTEPEGYEVPNTRESERYWATEAEAQAMLDAGSWQRRY